MQAAEEMAAMALVSFTLTEREDTRGDNSDTGAAVGAAATRRCKGSPLLNARLDRNIAPPFLRRSNVVAPQLSSQIAHFPLSATKKKTVLWRERERNRGPPAPIFRSLTLLLTQSGDNIHVSPC